MNPSGPPPSMEDARPGVYAAMCTCFPLAAISVVLRILARRLTKAGLWWDDWLIFAALIFDLGFLICTVILMDNGMGRHYQLITMEQYTSFLKTYIPAACFYASSISWTKLSILAFYWRIFSSLRAIRSPIYVLGTIVICWNIAIVCVSIFSCTPVEFWWNRTIPGGRCVDNFAFLLGNSIPNIATDIAILLLPLPFIWRLQQSLGKRLALSGVFLLAGFVCVVTIVRLVIQIQTDFDSPDLTWNINSFVEWTNVETSLAILSACLPSLRPILIYLRGGRPTSTMGAPSTRRSLQPYSGAGKGAGKGGSGGDSQGTTTASHGKHRGFGMAGGGGSGVTQTTRASASGDEYPLVEGKRGNMGAYQA